MSDDDGFRADFSMDVEKKTKKKSKNKSGGFQTFGEEKWSFDNDEIFIFVL